MHTITRQELSEQNYRIESTVASSTNHHIEMRVSLLAIMLPLEDKMEYRVKVGTDYSPSMKTLDDGIALYNDKANAR